MKGQKQDPCQGSLLARIEAAPELDEQLPARAHQLAVAEIGGRQRRVHFTRRSLAGDYQGIYLVLCWPYIGRCYKCMARVDRLAAAGWRQKA